MNRYDPTHDVNNTPKVTYTRGLDLSGDLEGAGGIGGLLARTDNTTLSTSPATAVAYYQCDANGNVTMLVNGNQAPVTKYVYDPFGNTLSMSGPLAEANTYRFSSKEIHPTTGLYNFGQRWYNPNLQRWMARDPAGTVDGPNLYSFVNNCPLNSYDPWGLFSWKATLIVDDWLNIRDRTSAIRVSSCYWLITTAMERRE